LKRILGISLAIACVVLLAAGVVLAKPTEKTLLSSQLPGESYRVGDVDGTMPAPAKALQDTFWIADWNFDGVGCNNTGWVKYDNRILNDSSNYWSIKTSFAGTGGIVNRAAVLAKHDLSWARDGYGNNWDYSIILKYRGASTLTFDYLSDSEPGFDYVLVEVDSAGVSEALVNYSLDPTAVPSQFRSVLMSVDGLQTATAGPLALPDFGVPATTHEVYIRLLSDAAYADEDGLYPSAWNAGLVVDDISVAGGLTYTEGFEGALNANVSLVNTAPATPFGEWARLYQHVTDNDKCSENTTCSWLVSDPLRTAFFPDMAFGPGSAVVRNWLDDIFVSPWVSLASTPSASGTILSYRIFGGNFDSKGRINLNWSIRSKVKLDNTDTSTIGDSVVAVGPWAHVFNWLILDFFNWATGIADMSPELAPGALEIQLRFRTSDWQYIAGGSPPATLDPGPGPYIDRVRIGRQVLNGPVFDVGIDTRTQAQDAFATVQNGILPGEHFSPASTIFGSCAFSLGTELGINATSPNLISGDSIVMTQISDVRGAGGITAVRWYGAITAGPHAGKAPAPYTVGGNGFFEVTPDSSRGPLGTVIAEQWHVDFDDTYFRGGDQMIYFWTALDAGGGRSSSPPGISAANFPPASIAAAELATDGLYEVSYLPTINWAPAYLARIAANAHGDLEPTPTEIAASSQRNCILYYNSFNNNRPSGEVNRTSFMYTLDRLGYRDYYDVYDHQGFGNTNNQLGGRASVVQASAYALIIHDQGRGGVMSDGVDIESEKVAQTQWYRDYLSQGLLGAPGIASLWIIGEDVAFEKQTNPLISTDCGLTSVVNDQALVVNPNVSGLGSFTFTNGNVASFAGDVFSVNGGCPTIRDYDGAMNGGTAVMTHRYSSGATNGTGAVIMNKNSTLKWNTIWMGFGWFDIRNAFNTPPASGTGGPDTRLARKILNAALPVNCVRAEDPTDTPDPEVESVPAVAKLHQNVPNPFNPTTTIQFDLARDGQVRLQVFDVAGHLVRTLVNGAMTRGYNQSATWNGLDESGRRVPSGVYFYQLVTDELTATKKMVMLK